MRRVVPMIACAAALGPPAPLSAQSEQQLRQAFEGRHVIVRLEMPATHRGVDVHPDREPSVDFTAYGARLREFGASLREGDRVLVTAVRVKKKNIEVHLGGGGYGVFGDDTGYVYVPVVTKSKRERDLEKSVRTEKDPERRRRQQQELDDLRRDRERDERYREAEQRDLEARKKSEIAMKRLGAGSRFNIWFEEGHLEREVPTPIELRRMLAPYVAFDGEAAPGRTLDRDAAPPGGRRGDEGDLRRGLSVEEVHDLLGRPARSKAGKQGDLETLTEWYEEGDRVTEIVYVAGVVVRFSTTSK